MEPLLEVKNLEISFFGEYGEKEAVKDISFSVAKGEIFGLVGESGSGKSVTAKAILNLILPNQKIKKGSILFEKQDLLKKEEKQLRKIRGKEISMIFQDSKLTLNPVYTIGDQLTQVIRSHHSISKKEAREKAYALLELVKIADVKKHFKSYPHQLSGGMRQRVMIAMAISNYPKMILADEPTTALDVTIQAQILQLLLDLQKKRKMSMILITHDLSVVAQMCSRAAIMKDGVIVEEGKIEDIFFHPLHSYTKSLIEGAAYLKERNEKDANTRFN